MKGRLRQKHVSTILSGTKGTDCDKENASNGSDSGKCLAV